MGYAGAYGPADKSHYEIDGNKIFYTIPGHPYDRPVATYTVSVTAIVDGCEDLSASTVVSTGGFPAPAPGPGPGDGNRDDTCPGLSPEVTAQDVERLKDPETLVAFVKEARVGIGTLLGDTVSEGEGIRNLVKCFGADGDWKHGSVHLFAITDERKYLLAPSGSGLAGTYLNLVDENGCDVAAEIIRAARGEALLCNDLGLLPEGDAGGFVQYLWDNPADTADDGEPGYEARGEAPGNSPKLSYVEGITNEEFLPGGLIVLGSGYYPEIPVPEPEGETSGSGGGCALAAETDARAGTAAVGLFLSAFAIGCAVFLGRRLWG